MPMPAHLTKQKRLQKNKMETKSMYLERTEYMHIPSGIEKMSMEKEESSQDYLEEMLNSIRHDILSEKSPVQRALGMYELKNPSANPLERIENRAIRIEGYDLVRYKAMIVKDKVGVDFMTNQPVYKEREIILE